MVTNDNKKIYTVTCYQRRIMSKKKVKEGSRNLSVWLEPDTTRIFDELKKQLKCKNQDLIKLAIESLHKATSYQKEPNPNPNLKLKAIIDKIAGKTAAKATFYDKESKPKRGIKTGKEIFEEILNTKLKENGALPRRIKPLLKEYFKYRQKGHQDTLNDTTRWLNLIDLKNFDGDCWKAADVKAILES